MHHTQKNKIKLQNMQNMKNHAVSGLTQKAQKDKLDNVFFIGGQNMQNKKTMQSVCFDTEPHKAHKKDKLDNVFFFVAEHAGHRKPRKFVQHRIHTRHPPKKKTNLTIILLLAEHAGHENSCRTWKIMQSCSTQNHTRGSWHQTELVRADLGSLMR